MDNTKYFYLGGVISLSFFGLICFGFITLLFSANKIKTFGLEKKNYISVSVVMPEKKVVHKQTHKAQKKSAASTPVLQTTKKIKNLDIEDLFSDVWTQKVNIKKPKKANSKRLAELQKKIKQTKIKKLNPEQTQQLTQESQTQKEQRSHASAEEVNEYLAKIQALVYKYFHVPPNTQGNSVKTVIELDPLGKVVDFRVLNYSGNEALDEEVDKMKERLMDVIFPKNPKNEYSRTTVVLISKE